MNEWKKVLISPNTKIQDVIKIIDVNSLQIALVINQEGKLLGTVTDGDIRRSILKDISLDSPVEQIMNKNPITITETKDRKSILNILKTNKLRHLPVVDDSGCVTGIERLEDILTYLKKDNWVIIMAGGQGNRLRPLTDNCPKPMLSIGNMPVLEIILKQLIAQGFYRFCFSINYMADYIKAYFNDGSKWGIEINYINEENAMGTAGSLSLFTAETAKPVVIMNGDILTKLDFEQLLDFHTEHLSKATVAVSTYDFQVPYGVVKVNKDRMVGFEEKPVFTSFINAGIYVFNPEVLKMIPANSYYDVNNLLETMLNKGEKVSAFPIREYWTDIGDIEDFNQAKLDFETIFA